ncbi:hypothetical protein [Saccharothrix obliqua]|uniref:hypothetical protein n=1 Tax=Saccharothrix obliqua TaxID=2861747 RepID=UPI001C5FE553|nr:hypothetical protein [Saccharothrix obliqua]MBW4722421.1 hypothetical protein [Saccharothrix obliqua]
MVYGDNHVDPVRLFDPQHEVPPADALDLHFPVPTSLSLFGDAVARTPDMAHLLPKLGQVYENVLLATVVQVQRVCGYVVHPTYGQRAAARLAITAISENSVPNESIMRIHGHLYVGRTATSLADGQQHPVNLTWLRQFVRDVWTTYLGKLEEATSEEFGLVWGALPDNHPADREIVEPPFAPHVAQHAVPNAVVCPGRYGPLERVLADHQWRIGIAESQVRVQAERRQAG